MTIADKPKILILNRGEIAVRVLKTCKKLGLHTVTVFTQVDAVALHAREGDTAVPLGDNPRAYTDMDLLLKVAVDNGVTAIHPGYGFLSENEKFVEKVEAAGITWLGPTSDIIVGFGLKHVARGIAEEAGVPVTPGSSLLESAEAAVEAARKIGYPVLIKATGGGGGRGIYICNSDADVLANFELSQHQGKAFFGNAGVFVEKFVSKAHHIEVQIFGDGKGDCVHLGERECSIQRRHQKVLEETPSPQLDEEMRAKITGAAVALGKAAKYRSAGTVEFLFDGETKEFYFLEVNTRLQVEHGVTELCHGDLDLVAWQLRLQVPGLEPLDIHSLPPKQGCCIEVRLNGEDPAKDFSPSPGLLGEVSFPDMEGVRVDTWAETGTEISPYYDSLLGKLMAYAPTRAEALEKLRVALAATVLKGVPTNLEFLRQLAADSRLAAGDTTTKFLEDFKFVPQLLEVISPGLQTSVQDWPGRVQLWHVGVPPSGPMDSLSHRVANALVGNDNDAAALEFSLVGPELKFHCDAVVSLCGAQFETMLDGKPVTWWSSFKVTSGQTLKIGALTSSFGARGYLAVDGGIDVPKYLGSRATFPGGQFGGYQGRYLRPGDSLPLAEPKFTKRPILLPPGWLDKYAGALKPSAPVDGVWQVGVLPGPHAAPDFFTTAAMDEFYASDYKVHYNSNRLGVRLNGPKPTWARTDGGEGGSHPSNVHDHVYALGTINYTGDMPVVLMLDGPSLGGFVCPATVVSTELWKIGQARPDDSIRFVQLSCEAAHEAILRTDALIGEIAAVARGSREVAESEKYLDELRVLVPAMPKATAVLARVPASNTHPGAELRMAGDRNIQIEYGPMELDLSLRVRVHALEQWFAEKKVPGVVETNPGVRSCMIEYEPRVLPLPSFLELLLKADAELPDVKRLVLPSRIVHLPMAWEDSGVIGAIEKYSRSVRPEAPYLPSNIQYIANNNGIESKEEVCTTIFDASYLVLGLGDVYLGAPCAVPLDPRHQLVTAKYNPARTFTAEGTVGIGGSYMCIYPMDSPGGYQLVGRTLPIWNTFGRTKPFSTDKPWLLEFFDQVRFFQVSEEELLKARSDFRTGHYAIKIESSTFDCHAHQNLLEGIKDQVAAMKARQKAAMAIQLQLEAESLERLEAAAAAGGGPAAVVDDEDESVFDKPGLVKVTSGFTANVWDIRVSVGDEVAADDVLVVLEAMKMESPIQAPVAGTVKAIRVQRGALAPTGTLLVVIEEKPAFSLGQAW